MKSLTAGVVLSAVLGTMLMMLSAAIDARELRAMLPDRGSVVLTIPDDWYGRVDRFQPEVPPTINLFPERGNAFHVLITPIWQGKPGIESPTREEVRDIVRKTADAALAQSVEKALPLLEMTGTAGAGFYFIATDRAPEPNGFLHLTQGMLALADLRVTFTVLANGDKGPVVEQALQIMKTMRRDSATKAEGKDSTTPMRFARPSSVIGMVFPAEDWVVDQERHRPDGGVVNYMLTSVSRKLVFSFYIDRTTDCQSAKTCLQLSLRNTAYAKAKDLEFSDSGPFTAATFFIDGPQNVKFYQANLLAGAYVDGQWFDLHISAVDTQRPDRALLLRFLNQIEIR